jgi:Transposase DDE domain
MFRAPTKSALPLRARIDPNGYDAGKRITGKKRYMLVDSLGLRLIVERTIAWLNRCRRLAKDWENLNRKALAFLRLASIRLMLRKLSNPA